MKEAIIQTTDVNREYISGNEVVHALRNMSITIPTGELTIIRGRSGSGKTTLMNIMGALDKPNSGDVLFMGNNLMKLSEIECDNLRRLNMGFIFQSVALVGQMSAYENVEFALRLAGTQARNRKERVEECLTFVGLAKRMHHRPQELSGGEQQRVAIARALAHHPKVIFADEPTADLDTLMALRIVMLFKDIVVKQGVTIIMTTHDPNMIEFGDNVYTLEDGIVVDHIMNIPSEDKR